MALLHEYVKKKDFRQYLRQPLLTSTVDNYVGFIFVHQKAKNVYLLLRKKIYQTQHLPQIVFFGGL